MNAPSDNLGTNPDFVAVTVLKRDLFSETVSGHAAGDPGRKLAMRRLDTLPWTTRWLGRRLARREARALRAVAGIAGTPRLYHADRHGLLRDWTAGTPLQTARPAERAWYLDARRLLREMRRRGVTHNDLAKPQNWLMTPEGRAAVIDFQLARVHRRKDLWFRTAGYEDLRHLAKMKRRFAPHLLTATEARIANRRSLPSRLWRATGKRLYTFVTRRLMHWSDNEGAESRADREGPALRARLLADPRVSDVAIAPFPMTGGGVGLYGFVVTDLPANRLRALVRSDRLELIQPVAELPPIEVLDLVAGNRIDELEALLDTRPDLRPRVAPIVRNRLNLTDRSPG